MKAGPTTTLNMTEAERTLAALTIWNLEKGTAAAVIIISWLSKVSRSVELSF